MPRPARSCNTVAVSNVELDISDRVATITLNDPDKRNAITLGICDEMISIMDDIEARDDVGAVVITGKPPAFCAGADLSHLGTSTRQGFLDIYQGFLRVGRSPLPTISAVNGSAVGAGMNLALITDIRLAAESAKFDARFLQIGLAPGGGHTWMYQKIAGPQQTFATVIFGEVLDGKEAERIGLVWKCVPDDELLDVAQKMAAKAAAAPPELVRTVKQTILDITGDTTQQAAMERELGPQSWSAEQPEFQALIAQLKKKISSKD